MDQLLIKLYNYTIKPKRLPELMSLFPGLKTCLPRAIRGRSVRQSDRSFDRTKTMGR